VVVNRYRQLTLGGFLPDHVLIKKVFYFKWFGNFAGPGGRGLRLIVFKDRVADGDALVADVCPRIVAWRGYQLSNNVLALMTKGTA
jgi:hypothetical protein